MRPAFAALAVLLFALGGCVTTENIRPNAAASALPASLTVMSFNIRLGVGPEDPKVSLTKLPLGRNLPAVINAIQAEGPDIVSLQEVAGIKQMREIAAALSLNYAFVPYGDVGVRGTWGVGILSKHPIVETRSAQISSGAGDTRRIVIATIRIGTRTLDAVAVHKDKDLKDGKSILEILKALSPANVPTLLIGDFNITPKDKRLAPLAERFADSCAAVDSASAREVTKVGTFPSSKRRIDYVFADKTHFAVKAARLGATAHREASDHIAFIADVAFKN